MPQDRQSGLEASRWGHRCARQIAEAIGAEMLGNKSNEGTWKGERALIKTARHMTNSVGVLYHMLVKLDCIVGAFQQDDGSFRVMRLSIQACEAAMRPTRSKGPSAGRVGIIPRKTFDEKGRTIGVLNIAKNLTT